MADINEIYELLGKENFEPKQIDTEERLDAIESALLDIIMGGGIND